MTNTTPAARPPEFDARVMQYLPGLRRLASKLGAKGEERDNLITDTIIEALDRWENYREDGGFWNWLYWTMRGKLTNSRDKKRLSISDRPLEDYAHLMSTAPAQEHHVELTQTLARMTARRGNVLVRRAMGDTLQEIGSDIGVGREAVRQLEERERAMLRRVA